MIGALCRWVISKAMRQAKKWTDGNIDFGSMAINVSAEEFRNPDFIGHIRNQLHETGIDPGKLQIELTESVLIRDVEYARQVLTQLKAIGFSLAVDDFGTGYSSLSYLAEFPIDVLKIDRSFIRDIYRSGTRQQALLQAIMNIAKSLSLVVVAEGIESIEEASFLQQIGCEQGQGYYYSKPLDNATFEQFLVTDKSGTRID